MNSESPAQTGADHIGPVGIGGWLVLPFLGLVLAPLLVLATLMRDLVPAFDAPTWSALTTPGGPAYHPMWAPYLIVSLAVNVPADRGSLLLADYGRTEATLVPRSDGQLLRVQRRRYADRHRCGQRVSGGCTTRGSAEAAARGLHRADEAVSSYDASSTARPAEHVVMPPDQER